MNTQRSTPRLDASQPPRRHRWLAFEGLEQRRLFAVDGFDWHTESDSAAVTEFVYNQLTSGFDPADPVAYGVAQNQITAQNVIQLQVGQSVFRIGQGDALTIELPRLDTDPNVADYGYGFLAFSFPVNQFTFDQAQLVERIATDSAGMRMPIDARDTINDQAGISLPNQSQFVLTANQSTDALLDVRPISYQAQDHASTGKGLHAIITPIIDARSPSIADSAPNYTTLLFMPNNSGAISLFQSRAAWCINESETPLTNNHNSETNSANDNWLNQPGNSVSDSELIQPLPLSPDTLPVVLDTERPETAKANEKPSPLTGHPASTAAHRASDVAAPTADILARGSGSLTTLDISLGSSSFSRAPLGMSEDNALVAPATGNTETGEVAAVDVVAESEAEAQAQAAMLFAGTASPDQHDRWSGRTMTRSSSAAFLISRVTTGNSDSTEIVQQPDIPAAESASTLSNEPAPANAATSDAVPDAVPGAVPHSVPEQVADVPGTDDQTLPTPVALRHSSTAEVVDRLAGSPLGILMAVSGIAFGGMAVIASSPAHRKQLESTRMRRLVS